MTKPEADPIVLEIMFVVKRVLVTGNFNVVHPGHLRLFKFARELGDELWVGVTSDRIAGAGAQVLETYRLDGVAAIGIVDHAFLFDESVEDVVLRIRPDLVVKGKEYEDLHNPEKEVVESYGARLLFSSGETVFSSMDILRRENIGTTYSSVVLPFDYMERHKISELRLSALISHFSDIRACVVGDLIVDEYITCDSLGMSQEDPTIVVTPISSDKFVGGAGIVAAHGQGLGANITLVSVVGDDANGQFAKTKLKDGQVINYFAVDQSRPTTLKQRFRSSGKTLLRVNHLSQNPISRELQTFVMDRVIEALETVDLLVFSDFNHGCLPQGVVDRLTQHALTRGVTIAADSQSSSQVGDVSRFLMTDLMTPTEREARIAMRENDDGLIVLIEKLRQKTNAKNILLKMGPEGVIVYTAPSQGKDFATDRVGALNHSPKDVAALDLQAVPPADQDRESE